MRTISRRMMIPSAVRNSDAFSARKLSLLFAFCLLTVWVVDRHSRADLSLEHKPESEPQPQPAAAAVSSRVYRYRRGIFKPAFTTDSRPSLSTIWEPVLQELPAESEDLGLKPFNTDGSGEQANNNNIISVPVSPDPSDSGTQYLLFGVATEIDRLEARFASFSHFLGGSNATLLALVPPSPSLAADESALRARGLPITLIPSTLPFTRRYFHLVRALRSHIDTHRPLTRWICLIDDDTFLPALHHLSSRLSALSHGRYHYIGALSEASWQVQRFGRMGFGGASVLLSVALLDGLDEMYAYCASAALGALDMPGDGRLAACIRVFDRRLDLTAWSELRQWDLKDNPDGVFEAGRPIWSFHHFSAVGGASWMSRDLVKMAAVAEVAGEAAVLQRWKFDAVAGHEGVEEERREFFVLTNGYSIARYVVEASVLDIDFAKTEYTWDQEPSGYEKALGPFRAKDVEGVTKKTWLLQNAAWVGNNFHQLYEHSNTEEKDVIEIIWLGEDQ